MYKRIQNIPSSYFIFWVLACMVGLMLKYHVVQWAVAFLFDFLISVRAFLASMDGWDYLLGLMGISGLVGVVVKFRLPRLSFWVLLALLSSAMLSSVASWFITSPSGRNAEWWTSWLQNFSTEMFGAITTFILFELIIGGNEKEQARLAEEQARLADEKASKDDMIRRLRSEDSAIVKIALDEAREKGWLHDGTLKGAHLGLANLRNANLQGANLQGANLWSAYLEDANLEDANLERATMDQAYLNKATLTNAHLQNSILKSARLQYANLEVVNLENANLENAQLDGADLLYANLMGACLLNAKLQGAELTNATLPDGTKWTPETDMERFTNKEHPQFSNEEWLKNCQRKRNRT